MVDINMLESGLLMPPISESGALVSFNAPVPLDISSLKVAITPVQSGTGDPSPTNIRPITGWTGANVYRTGQNLFDESTIYHGYYLPSTPSSHTASEAYRTAIVTLPRGTYTFKCDLENIVVIRYAIGKTNHPLSTSVNPLTFDVDETSVVQVCFRNADTSTITETFHTQIEAGSSASAYSPYNGTVYPVSWSDSAGTVYGGTLDVVSGTLTVDRKYVTLSSLTWTRRGIRLFSASISGNADVTIPASEHLCDYFPTEYVSSYTSTQALHLALYKASGTVSSGSIYLKLTSAEISDSSAEFNQWLIDNPVHLCYKLRTPVEYTLTPTEVQTLLGINNIWADCGDITLKTSPVFGELKIRLMEEGISIVNSSPLLRSASAPAPDTEEDTKTEKEPIEDIVKEPVDEKDTVKELPEDENEPEPEDEEVTEDDNEG